VSHNGYSVYFVRGGMCLGRRIQEAILEELFLATARKLSPDICGEDLQWAYAGIRPKS